MRNIEMIKMLFFFLKIRQRSTAQYAIPIHIHKKRIFFLSRQLL